MNCCAQSVAVGDPLCQKKMFYGVVDLEKKKDVKLGMLVVFLTMTQLLVRL